MILSENLILLGAIIFCLAIIAIIFMLAKREEKIAIKTTKEERKMLEENFSARIIKNTTITKNTELVELEAKVPNEFTWSLEIVDDVDGSEREIEAGRYGNNGSMIKFIVYKGRNMNFIITGWGTYASKKIEIPYVT